MDAQLARGLQRRLFRLAGYERVVAFVGRLDQPRAAAAGDHRDAFDALGPLGEDEGLAPGGLPEPLGELANRDRLCKARAGADAGERFLSLRAEAVGEQRVVAELGVRVESKVVGDE